MRILPAGVPRGLSQLGHRLRAAAANTPLFFIGVVIAIAVVFRLGLGVVKPAAAADEEPAPARPHVSVPTTVAQATPTTASPAAPATTATPAVAAEPEPAPKATLPRRKGRTHGKR